ncbi:hypothetical protein HID58_077917 [Brassica napus]|uniref:Uncharacterized protein n=1 Tax=Brassica napus TaxID=3708 RepID=A0ABQ7YRN9_BRANA|nr:hypothetical protein HID58_077917 [Brassica napus]
MASSDKAPVACPAGIGECKEPMGDPTKTTTAILEKGTAMMQSMKPIKQMSLHMDRIYSVREIQMALLVTPRIPELVAKPELKNLANSYGKFWCTWQFDRRKQLVITTRCTIINGVATRCESREDKTGTCEKESEEHGISTESLKPSREGICGPEKKNMVADYWVRFRKGFALDVVETDMKKTAPFPKMRHFHLRFVPIRLVEDYLDGPLLSLRFRRTIRPDIERIEKWVLRIAFDDEKNPYLPKSAARATVPGGPSVPCSTAKAVEWDAAWSQNLDLSGRAALGVHVAAYEEDKAEDTRPKKLQAEKTAEGIV